MNQLRNESATTSWKGAILMVSMIAMLIGLLYSRAILSSSLIVFILVSTLHRNILHQARVFFSSPLLWSMSVLFLLPFISGLWSTSTSQWLDVIRTKLPLVLLPICFAENENLKYKDWQKLAFVFVFIIFSGVCWSMWIYLQQLSIVHAAYLRAHTINTPLGNDHVRFSLLVAIAILTCLVLLFENSVIHKRITVGLLWGVSLVFIAYLHVLAARTGLFCLYGGFIFSGVWLVWQQRKKMKYLFFILLAIALPLAAYFTLPTFKNRVDYLRYDLSLVWQNIYRPGSNDGNRIASIRSAWQLLNQKPFAGVGFGDIKMEMDKIYEAKFPQMKTDDKILPSSEWMMYGAGNGWPGIILFSAVIFMPLFIKGLRLHLAWILLNLFIVSSYLFDIGLEVQYGVFAHAFVLLWWYKWLRAEK